ncbi:MAG TPA: class I SAM-dependent methyltransferase [Candidatus Binatia bacterium]|jgi:SAM-dependent methyltransferase
MSHDDQIRWDRQHAERQTEQDAAPFLRAIFESRQWDVAPGRALDIACGSGRHALFLAEIGFEVTAVDISPVALARGAECARKKSLSILWQEADLENCTLETAGYDLIVNIDYLQRSLLPMIKAALKVGGWVIFETYLIDQQTLGHPKNPNYLLRHNELLESFREFRVLYYREGKLFNNGDRSFRAGIFAQKR